MSKLNKFFLDRAKTLPRLFLIILIFLGSGSGSSSAGLDLFDLRSLLPKGEEFKGWRAENSAHIFKGKELFTYMDGGAEIYFEYGFRQVLVQDFNDDQDHRLSLEVFEMESPESAFGIFSYKRNPAGEPIDIGTEAQITDYYLNLWKSNWLVTIIGSDEVPQTKEGLFQLARVVAKKIPNDQPKPALLNLFPEKGLLTQTIKLFKGPLGLFNDYPFFSTNVFEARTMAKANYQTGESLFLFEYPDDRSCQEHLSRVKEAFSRSDRYSDFADNGYVFRVSDDQERALFGASAKNYMILIITSGDSRTAGEIFELVKQKISQPH